IGFSLVLPIWMAIDAGVFPYVIGAATQVPYLLFVPTNPLIDFIAFWGATGGGLLAFIIGFFVPSD
ncbi:MAG: hypothetical protein KAQ77_14295, partial [Candidatus Heimdallarchaeota archaeon]|nr:hypothetical protein [Candidatus Heimdallarchaeota archaeon]